MRSVQHALVTAAVALGLAAAPASAAPPGPGQLLAVPAYFHPSGEGAALWNTLGEGGVGLAVANPFSGPGKDFDPAYAAAIRAAHDHGVTVLGYVATGYLGSTGRATRLGETTPLGWLAQTQQDVATWYRLYGSYGLGGIFFDEVQNTCGPGGSWADTYKELDASAKRLHHGAFTVINPGIGTDACYADIADVSLTFEGTYEDYRTWSPPTWQRGRDPRRFWHLVHATPDTAAMTDAMRLSQKRNAGYVYVTPDVLANPWDSLPPAAYWSAEKKAARPTADATAPPPPGPALAVGRDATSLTLAWRPSPGTAGYEVSVDGPRVTGTAGSLPAVTLEGLRPSTSYSVTVRARDLAGNLSPASPPVRLTTGRSDGRPPAAPAGVRPAEVKVASVRLAWTPPADRDLAAYDLAMDGEPLLTVPAAADTVPVSGLTPGSTHTFTLTARDRTGNTSPAAGPVTVTTPLPTGDPITETGGVIDAETITYRARFTLPFDFHHVYVDADSDPATGFATAGIGADFLIENGWFYRHAGTGWSWTPVDAPSPLISFADDRYVWRVPRSIVGDGPQKVVFHGSGSSPESYSKVVEVR